MRKTCFNGTLFLKNVTRLWPLWVIYLVLWLLVLPLSIIGVRAGELSRVMTTHTVAEVSVSVTNSIISVAALVNVGAFAFSAAAAMALFRYMYHTQSVNYYHSLPVTRTCLFFTSWVSGLAFIIVPNLIVFAVSAAVGAANGLTIMPALVWWLVSGCVQGLFFFSFAAFCAQFTGQTLALPAFYGILSVLAPCLDLLVRAYISQSVTGFGSAGIGDAGVVSVFLSPIVAGFSGMFTPSMDSGAVELVAMGRWYLGALALAGIIFAALGLLVYRRRQSETAGDFISVPAIRPVFKYGSAFCFALGCGLLFEAMTGIGAGFSYIEFIIWMTVVGFVVCFAAEMLIRKTFHVFKRKAMTGWAVFAVVMLALSLCFELDVLGVERRVPDESRIESVSVNPTNGGGSGQKMSDPETIALATEAHRRVVNELEEIAEPYENGRYDFSEDVEVISFGVEYTLKGGRVMERGYTLGFDKSDLSDPDSAACAINELMTCREYRESNIPPDIAPSSVLSLDATLMNDPIEGFWKSRGIQSDDPDEPTRGEFYGATAADIYAAMLEDVRAARIGGKPIGYQYNSVAWIEVSFQTAAGEKQGLYINVPDTATSTIAAIAEAFKD